jgi:hypothetical protein
MLRWVALLLLLPMVLAIRAAAGSRPSQRFYDAHIDSPLRATKAKMKHPS